QFVGCLLLVLRRQNDGGLDHLAADLVGNTGDGALHYSGMGHDCTLYLKWTDAVSRAFDDIVLPTYKPVVPIFVAPGHIAGMVEVVGIDTARKLFIAIISHEQG